MPPYGTLTVSRLQDWVALAVYVVVMVLVAGVVVSLERAREASQWREANAGHLLDLSELLLVDKPVPELAEAVVKWAHDVLGLQGVALLLSVDDRLEVVASSGTEISRDELSRLRPEAGLPVALSTVTSHDAVQTLALASSGRPVGAAGNARCSARADGARAAADRRQPPRHRSGAGSAPERILHAEVLEEIDRLRHSLIGAVSHDLRTPLATIKVASSTFLDRTTDLSPGDADELHSLIDLQADRLTAPGE